MDTRRGTLVIACGALAREIAALRRANDWSALDVRCLPAELHNRPERIAPAVRAEIAPASRPLRQDLRRLRRLRHRRRARRAACARKASSGCPARTATSSSPRRKVFEALAESEPGTFYLTDFLLQHFERLVIAASARPPPGAQGRVLPQLPAPGVPGAGGQARQHRARARDRDRLRLQLRVSLHRVRGAGGAPAHPRRERGLPGMASLIIISWRDMPAQVVVKRGRETAKVQLSARFQEAVDRAAMRAGKGSSDAYLADWKRSDPRPCGDDLKAEAAAEAARIEARLHRRGARGADPRQGPAKAGGPEACTPSRHWSVRHARGLNAFYRAFESALVALHPLLQGHRLRAPRAPGRRRRARGQGAAVRLPHVRAVHPELHRHVLPDELPEEPAQRSVRRRARERQLRSDPGDEVRVARGGRRQRAHSGRQRRHPPGAGRGRPPPAGALLLAARGARARRGEP